MKKRAFLLIVMIVMVGTLCACEKQSTGKMQTTGGSEQTVSEKEKASSNNTEQGEPGPVMSNKENAAIELRNILDEINTDIQLETAGTYMTSVRVASYLLNWGVGTSMGTEEIKREVLEWLSKKDNDEQVSFSRKLSSVYDAYQQLLGPDAEELLSSAGGDMSGYPWSDSPVETIEAIIDVVQLPDNDEEKSEENTELGSENENYPGEEVVELVNLKGESTTVYKVADGRYMDRVEQIFIFDGVDTWIDTNGVEWNKAVN